MRIVQSDNNKHSCVLFAVTWQFMKGQKQIKN